MKPKTNQKGNVNKSHGYDQCQTPFYALDPLIPYLPQGLIWESASGEGNIVSKLKSEGFPVIASDILSGKNFFKYTPDDWICQVTNPPYSIKYEWLAHSYQLEKPFALLLPLETLGAKSGQKLFEHYGIEIILLNKRINFKMPNAGYSGKGAQFPVAWFTFGLNIGKQIIFGNIRRYEDDQVPLFNHSHISNIQDQLRMEI
jgi:hypothetical protein